MHADKPYHLYGKCQCGTFSFATTKVPKARFVFHCLFCQDFTGEAYADVTVLFSNQIVMDGAADLIYKKYRLPPNLNRGRCHECGKPAVETMGAKPFKIVFVPSRNFVQSDQLPSVRFHAFYNRRVTDVIDDLPKYSHYWPSQLAISKMIMGI